MKYFQFVCIWLIACQPDKTPDVKPATFESAIRQGTIRENKITEASGLVASVNNSGMLWTHNDSGNTADIFLIDEKGEIKCTVHLAAIKNRDWEDIAVGVGPEEGKHYIYIGEIGDNNAAYDTKFLYRVEEPNIPNEITDTTLHNIDRIEFKLSDGARDSEALMIDPVSGNFYIFSKRESKVNLYKLPFPLSTTQRMTAERVLEKLPFTSIVAADISKDGNEVLVKNYDNVFYWKRVAQESIEEVLKRSPEKLPYTPEPQGESIAFDLMGRGYYTISEQKRNQPQCLYFYKRN